ncbi:hypothetical protein FE257_010799 [Aspergillus nanangensis]|uniref:LysM domain-containing protein n=1 Tax=Aspergillus nanangensis TaxID=2582783 RepID=A0AAD4GY02_ASPNN|nr:hypothetical protein FE257_010799 [Aspergillus nanangensis]
MHPISLLLFVFSASAHQASHHHIKHHARRDTAAYSTEAEAENVASTPTSSPMGLSKAEQMVKDAHASLRVFNKGQLAYPEWNQYKFQERGAKETDRSPPDLGSNEPTVMKTALSRIQLDDPNREVINKDNTNFKYRISDELAAAARIVAEASPLPIPGDYGVDIAKVIGQYRITPNDTNVPLQAHRGQNGLEGTNVCLQKVFRNVKDYGAKGLLTHHKFLDTPIANQLSGNGVTDDTAAINKAISDGGRCGPNCGSSTIYPAFVYFPPGTYLVSSPIIQYYNTEFYGNPLDYPTILAASSFVGLGVITSDVYTGDTTEWYSQAIQLPKLFDCTSRDSNMPQGIYMENGSGGFLGNLTFVGGNFGAYFGNQQFTTSHLKFLNCKTALQIHWDWAWTMQDIVITNCTQGIVIVGGAGGGPSSTGQSVGALIVVDTVIAFTETAILTSLMSENSTSFLLQNANFIQVGTAIKDNVKNRVLMAGGPHVTVDSWGFGLLATSSTNSTFINGQNIPAMNKSSSLTSSDGYLNKNWFQRRRPAYTDIGNSQVFDVMAWGAAGDGVSDDTGVLNSILDRAANLSSIVYFPFGIYKITDTLYIPPGSRIIGQAWAQIMASGAKFQNEFAPHVAVKVGSTGDVGIIEMQSMMFTVSGPTAGAILMEWNIHESSTQGSAAMWDCHFRVGGAIGSHLRASDCPTTGAVRTQCKAASLLLHLTPKSSAYLENIWLWTADHDLDMITQDQISVYSARGVLVESQGPTWIWFSDYTQDCLDTENCQQRGVEIAQSTDVWLYNLATKGIVEMVSPVNEKATLSTNNMNGFMASILAWVREQDEVIGQELFPGFQIYALENLNKVAELSATCKTALSQTIHCAPYLETRQSPSVGQYFENSTDADIICAPSCGESLKSWFDNVSSGCMNQTLGNSHPTLLGGYIYAAYNQTCLKDTKTGNYSQICSYCHMQKYIMRQASAYTAYDVRAQDNLKLINRICGLEGPTDMPDPVINVPVTPKPMCLSDITHIIQKTDTCDSIALQYSVASAAIQSGNPTLINDCSNLVSGREICIPLSCENIYTVQDTDTCFSIETDQELEWASVWKCNPWLDYDCSDLQAVRPILGSVICLSPQGMAYNDENFVSQSPISGPAYNTGYTTTPTSPPDGATLAEGSPWFCGKWHTVSAGETCTTICMQDGIPAGLFLEANPSLSQAGCDESLIVGVTYCTGPDEYWDNANFWGEEWPGSPTGPVS